MSSREDLVDWERRLDALGVEYTPIRDVQFGAHLNFRDPDHIALELTTSKEIPSSWLEELKVREIPRHEIDARLREYLASLQQPRISPSIVSRAWLPRLTHTPP